MYGTTHAYLVHMCWPLSWALHQMGHSFATFSASKEVAAPKARAKAAPQPRVKPAAKRTGLAMQAGAKAAAKPAPRAIASSSSASATYPVPVMQTEHVQQFIVCYSRTQKFFTIALDPQ